jgi:type III secretion protein D
VVDSVEVVPDMNAPFVVKQSTQWVLRVLNGRLAGAERPLHVGKYLRIGHALDNDIVLRGQGTAGISLLLDLADDQARVQVTSGEIALLGRPIGVNEEAVLPPYVPLQIGEFAVAIGGDAEERWQEAERIGQSIALPPITDKATAPERAGIAERLATRLYPVRDHFTNRSSGMWFLAVLGILLLGFTAIAPITDAIRGELYSPRAVKETLSATGFTGLKVTRDVASQTLIVSGAVSSDNDAMRLRKLMADKFPGALVDVTTPGSLAAAATDILRNNKVDAEARPGRSGAIRVVSEYLPQDRQIELTALLKRDLPTLKTVEYQMDNRRGDRDLQYFFNASRSGLATFVDGNPGYIVTQDQTRWFVGSVVPTGHKILGIGNGRIIFERQGLIEELVM